MKLDGGKGLQTEMEVIRLALSKIWNGREMVPDPSSIVSAELDYREKLMCYIHREKSISDPTDQEKEVVANP